MKAIVYTEYGPPEVLQLTEVEKPVPRENELLVKVYASTVSSGVLWARTGVHPDSRFFTLAIRVMFGLRKPKKTILGYELSGEVEDVGEDVQLFKKGDQVFFYHSNCDEPGIVGIAEVVREAYPDFTAWDPEDKHYDAKTDPENPRWYMVDIRFVRKFGNTVSLKTLKDTPALKDMRLVQRGNRLSVMPVTKKEWGTILKMESK